MFVALQTVLVAPETQQGRMNTNISRAFTLRMILEKEEDFSLLYINRNVLS